MKHGRARAMYLFMQEVKRLAAKRGLVTSDSGDDCVVVWDRTSGGDRLSIDFVPKERPKEWVWNGKSSSCCFCGDGPCQSFRGMMHDSVCLEGILKIAEGSLVSFDDPLNRLKRLEIRVGKLEEKQEFETEI